MALIGMEGFENGHFPIINGVTGSGTQASGGYPAGRTGGSAISFAASATTGISGSFQFGASYASGGVGYAYNGNTTHANSWIGCIGDATVTHFTVRRNSSTGYLEAVLGTTGAVLATSTVIVPASVWLHFGIEWTISDTVGVIKVWMNDVLILNVSGIDNRNGGTAAATRLLWNTNAAGSGASFNIDDFYFYDLTGPAPYNAFLGDCVIDTLRPNGNGATNAWVGSDGNSTDNYLLVDDASTTSDYVGSGVSTNRDLYAMADLPASAQTVLATQIEVYAAKSDAGAVTDLKEVYRSATPTVDTAVIASSALLSTSYQFFKGAIRTTNPDAAGWTTVNVNNAQMGVEVG